MDIWMDTVGGKKKGRVAGLGSFGRTMKNFSSKSSNLSNMPEDVDEMIRSTVHSLNASLQVQFERERQDLNASLQAQLEKERQEKEEMKKELTETRNTLNHLMEQLGFRSGSSSRPQLSARDKNDEDHAHLSQQDDTSEGNDEELPDE